MFRCAEHEPRGQLSHACKAVNAARTWARLRGQFEDEEEAAESMQDRDQRLPGRIQGLVRAAVRTRRLMRAPCNALGGTALQAMRWLRWLCWRCLLQVLVATELWL